MQSMFSIQYSFNSRGQSSNMQRLQQAPSKDESKKPFCAAARSKPKSDFTQTAEFQCSYQRL